jgi:hypothetical protein
MEELLLKLGKELVNSPYLSVMIVDDDNNIVWHNERFAKDFLQGDNLVGKKCYHVTGSNSIHDDCPLALSVNEQKRVKGYLDFSSQNFFFLTVPLDAKHAAKVHVFLPKQPDNHRETK